MQVLLGAVTATYLDTSVRLAASHVDASHGASGFVMAPWVMITTHYRKLRGRGEFLEKTRKKPLYKIFGRPLFLKT